MSELLAVNNNDFEITVTPTAIPSTTVATPNNGSSTPVSPALFGINDTNFTEDDKCKCSGDKVLVTKLNQKNSLGANVDFSCAPLSVSPFTFTPPGGVYTILAGSSKVKCSSQKVMLEGDETTVNCVCAGVDSTTPTPIAFTGSCSIKISKAGQTKVKAE